MNWENEKSSNYNVKRLGYKLAFRLQIVHFRLQTCVSITKVAFRFTNATSRITIKLLKKLKYPPEGMEDAVQTVMVQCELWVDNEEM